MMRASTYNADNSSLANMATYLTWATKLVKTSNCENGIY